MSWARRICDHFKFLIEHKGVRRERYHYNGQRKTEPQVQRIFYMPAQIWIEATNSDVAIDPKVPLGPGTIDFKFSRGSKHTTLLEMKLSHHQSIVHGYTDQLPAYMVAVPGSKGLYMVIDNGKGSEAKLLELRNIVGSSGPSAPPLIQVDGTKKLSASKKPASKKPASKKRAKRSR